MRSIDPSFYHTPAWRKARAAYLKLHPLCEECWKKGLVTPAQYVDHIEELTPENVNDPNISLSFENFRALCFDCHEIKHKRKIKKRWKCLPDGTVVIQR